MISTYFCEKARKMPDGSKRQQIDIINKPPYARAGEEFMETVISCRLLPWSPILRDRTFGTHPEVPA